MTPRMPATCFRFGQHGGWAPRQGRDTHVKDVSVRHAKLASKRLQLADDVLEAPVVTPHYLLRIDEHGSVGAAISSALPLQLQ